jgi:hypothetical protein
LFDDAVSDVEAQPEPVEQPAAVEPEKEKTVEAAPETDDVEDNGSPVPSSRFRQAQEEKRAARAERDALKQERDRLLGEQQEFRRWMMSQQQQPKPAEQPKHSNMPDPLLDPQGHAEYLERRWEEREARVEQRLLGERRERSLQDARKTYKQEFDEAYEAAMKHVDPALRAHMQQSSDPGETLMGWFRELKVRNEVGTDLGAYEKKVREKLLKDTEFRKEAMETWRGEASTQVSGRPNVSLPPSMNGISRSSAALRASQEDLSDDALWDTTTT